MPRPHCDGWRPNVSSPSGVLTLPYASLTRMESQGEFLPPSGGSWLPEKIWPGTDGSLVLPSNDVPCGVDPRTRLSSTSTSMWIDTVSEMWIVGSSLTRMLAEPMLPEQAFEATLVMVVGTNRQLSGSRNGVPCVAFRA